MIGLPAAKGQDSPLHLGIVPDQDQLDRIYAGSSLRIRIGISKKTSLWIAGTQVCVPLSDTDQ